MYKPVLALMAHNNVTRVKKLEINLKKSFRKFTGLSKSTDDAVLARISSFDVPELALRDETISVVEVEPAVAKY